VSAQGAESVATYTVSLHLQVQAASAKEAVALVERDVRRHLFTWPVEMGAATRLIDGDVSR
jgi:hypothetical protein